MVPMTKGSMPASAICGIASTPLGMMSYCLVIDAWIIAGIGIISTVTSTLGSLTLPFITAQRADA
jgi:hypothetical protein